MSCLGKVCFSGTSSVSGCEWTVALLKIEAEEGRFACRGTHLPVGRHLHVYSTSVDIFHGTHILMLHHAAALQVSFALRTPPVPSRRCYQTQISRNMYQLVFVSNKLQCVCPGGLGVWLEWWVVGLWENEGGAGNRTCEEGTVCARGAGRGDGRCESCPGPVV